MSRIDLICPVCGHHFELNDQYIIMVRKHMAGPLYCSRRCIEAAELAAEAMRLSAPPDFARMVRRGPEAPTHARVRRA